MRTLAFALCLLLALPALAQRPAQGTLSQRISQDELVDAAARGDLARVRALVVAGGNVNWQNARKDSVFLVASARGHAPIVQLALDYGADLKSTNRYGGTALIPACHYGHVEVVKLLLQTQIDVNHVNDLGWTALLEAVMLGDGGPRYQEIVNLLLRRGAKPNLADPEGVTPLAHAKKRGYEELARLIALAGGR